MLRIKEEKRREFCDKANELGFFPNLFTNYAHFLGLFIDEEEFDLIIDLEPDEEVLNVVFDLIEAGFVERVNTCHIPYMGLVG